MCIKIDKIGKQEVGIWWVQKRFPRYGVPIRSLCLFVTKYQISAINSCWEKCDEKYLGRMEGRTEVKQYTPLPLRGGGGIIKYEKWANMFNVYKNQQSRQTGSRNLMGQKTLPTIWYTYIKVITKLPNSEQSYKGKVKTHNYINRQNQSTTGKLWKP